MKKWQQTGTRQWWWIEKKKQQREISEKRVRLDRLREILHYAPFQAYSVPNSTSKPGWGEEAKEWMMVMVVMMM